jgi:hypothetical protein
VCFCVGREYRRSMCRRRAGSCFVFGGFWAHRSI